MHDDVGVPEALPEGRAERNARDLLARIGVDHQAGIRHIGLVENRGGDAQPIEHRNHIGAELDAIADGAELRRLLENVHVAAGAAQCECGCQSAEDAAHDDDWSVRAAHSDLVMPAQRHPAASRGGDPVVAGIHVFLLTHLEARRGWP